MQLITLNTWGSRIKDIYEFVKKHSHSTDVFCFQEVYLSVPLSNLDSTEEDRDSFKAFESLLPDFTGYFCAQADGSGMAVFVKKKYLVTHVKSTQVLSVDEMKNISNGEITFNRLVQTVSLNNPKITIYNFHGMPGDKKRDNPERDLQNKRLMEVLNADSGLKVLVGDFNLNPDTKTIKDLESTMQNPLNGSGFKTTRSRHYINIDELPFADYVFLSSSITIGEFKVLPDEISDHLALQVNFDVR